MAGRTCAALHQTRDGSGEHDESDRPSRYGSPDVLELRNIDKPLVEDNEVLVRVRAAGVNMADVDYLRGQPHMARLGLTGHELW